MNGMLIDIVRDAFFIFLGVILTIWCETLVSPRLSLKPGGAPAELKASKYRSRFLRIQVTNNPIKIPFVPRKTASAVHGTVSFINNANGKQIGNPMDIRWDGAPEPLNYQIHEGKVIPIRNPDPRLLRVSKFVDIPPDGTESMTIAVRIFGEKAAYGWTSESYYCDWRLAEFTLPQGKYTARIILQAGDNSIKKEFRFNNLDGFETFDFAD